LQAALLGRDAPALIDHVPERRGEIERGRLAVLGRDHAAVLEGQPVLVLLRLEHGHLAAHDRVAGAAVLRAEDLIAAGRGGVEPGLRVPAGQNVLLDAELWNVERLDDVARGHQQSVVAPRGNAQEVDRVRPVLGGGLSYPFFPRDYHVYSISW